MDPFSAGTGALSVISLAIQLGAGVNKLWALFNSISDAPKEFESILEDLRLLRTLLASIQETEEVLGPDAVTNEALEICRKSIKNLTNIVDSLAPGFASQNSVKRKWTAIEAVMRTEEILKFKAGLEEAKSSLILAQSISLERNNRHRHQCIEQALLPLQQLKRGMSEIHEIHNSLIFQSRTMTTTDPQASNSVDGLSSEIHKAVESWSSKQLQPIVEAELSKAIQVCVSNMNQEQKPESNTASASNDKPTVTTFPKALIRRRRKVGPPQSRSTRTGFGTLRCFLTTHEVVREVISPSDVDGDDANFGPVKQTETNIRFIFTPSRWLIKVGATQVLQFEKIKSDSRCWQKTLRTFKLVPHNALIFKFCREGNVGAVRRLLIDGHASVDDVNGFGETPLHVAAGHCQAETCLFLLQQGADRNVRDWGIIPTKPFRSACSPGQQMNLRRRSLLPSNFGPSMINTMKAFLSMGEELDEAASEGSFADVLRWENRNSETIQESIDSSPSKWLLGDIIPAIEPFLLPEDFWTECALACLASEEYNPSFIDVLRNGGFSSVRWTLDFFIYRLAEEDSIKERTYTEFKLLAEYAGGLCYLHYFRGGICSPLSFAMRCEHSFLNFVKLLKASSIDIHEVVQYEISVSNNAWTEDTLLTLLAVQFVPYTGPTTRGFCKSCSWRLTRLDLAWDIPMQIRICRAKERIEPFSPPDEVEIRYHAAWDTVVKDYASGLCFRCGVKRHKKKWPFLADMLMNGQTAIWPYVWG